LEKAGLPPENLIAVTMPGFGTSGRTYGNALALIDKLGARRMEISIKEACIQHYRDIGLPQDDRSTAYENAQARERTQILMDIGNKENALMVGTGDMSEAALGWCT
ncbi:MAG: NAD(+) synthase, partial [Angelakisella sp.]